MVDAKKFEVPDIQPAGFIIEIIDDEQKPVSGVGFSVYVDGVGHSAMTDENGMLKVPKPKSELKISLADEEVSSTGEVSETGEEVSTAGEEASTAGEEPAKESEPPAPEQSQTDASPMPSEPEGETTDSEESTEPEEKNLSGKDWVSKFPTSTSLDDLDTNFKDKVEEFINALEGAGANVTINATKRPKERAYLMHWSWKIVNENHDASKISSQEGVDINWWHGNQAKSKTAAEEMVNGYGISNLGVAPSLKSRHIEGKAIDMNISWSGDLNIQKKDGSEVTIATTPRDGTNAKLIEVGAGYGVIHFKNVEKDKPHWSTDGK